jgi:hypothetical protein
MNYIEWNKQLWDYFFKPEFKNTNQKIVLAVNEQVINEIGIANNISNPKEDFIKAINDGPSEIDSNNVNKFPLNNDDFLSRAKGYIDEPNYQTRYKFKSINVPRWTKDECLFTAYLAYLVLMITDEERGYWKNVNNHLNTKTTGGTQKQTELLFQEMSSFAKKRGFDFFHINLFKRNKYVGRIYSQLPLTGIEEKQIIASLYFAKKENPDGYAILSDNLSFEKVVEFLEDQITHLYDLTAKVVKDSSSELRNVIRDYVFQNFSKYIQACEDACDEEMKVILEKRKSARENFKPEFFYCINENKIKGLILVNLRLNSSLKEGELTFKCGKEEFMFNTRMGKNVWADNGENYKAYLIDIINMPPGTYKIYNGEIDTKYTFTLPPVPDFKSPIWYKDYSRSNPELKVIAIEKKIQFDINNPYKIITQKDHGFTQEENNKYSIISLGSIFKIGIGDSDEEFQIFSISLADIDEKFELAEKEIEITNNELDLKIQGAPDGKRGKTSFLPNVPITISYNATSASKIKIKDSEDKVIQEIETNQNSLDTIFSTIIEPKSEGDYIIELTDKNNNTILKEFRISVGNISGQRIEKNLDYYVCDFKKLLIEKTIENNQTSCTISIKQELIEELIDILIKGKKLTSIYDNDFKYILNSLFKKYDINEALLNSGIDALELSKKIIYLLDNLNIIEREGHYIKTITKPYWIASSIDRRYNLVGALTSDDIIELDGITSIKSRIQTVYRTINKELIAFELPRQFYVEKCDDAKIPKTDKYPLHINYQLYDFKIAEPSKEVFILESQTLKVSNQDYSSFIPINNLRVLNWFTLKYEHINQEQFKEMVTFWGHKLVEIESRKNYNNRVVKHYFLFTTDGNGIYYSYFPYEQRSNALRLYLKKVKHFDLTTLIKTSNDDEIKSICKHLMRTALVNKKHLEALNSGNTDEIKPIINYQNALQLNFNGLIKKMFLYDNQNSLFAIHNSLNLPKDIEKYLVSISGKLPFYREQNISVPVTNINDLSNGTYWVDHDVNFIFYENIPEEVAYKISNSLISQLVAPNIGEAKPYTESTLN